MVHGDEPWPPVRSDEDKDDPACRCGCADVVRPVRARRDDFAIDEQPVPGHTEVEADRVEDSEQRWHDPFVTAEVAEEDRRIIAIELLQRRVRRWAGDHDDIRRRANVRVLASDSCHLQPNWSVRLDLGVGDHRRRRVAGFGEDVVA